MRALGLKVWKREVEKGDFLYLKLLGLSMQKLKLLSSKCLMDHYWNLLEYRSHPTKPTASKYESNNHGCSHVAFTVQDVEEIVSKIVQLGGSIINCSRCFS